MGTAAENLLAFVLVSFVNVSKKTETVTIAISSKQRTLNQEERFLVKIFE